MSADARGCLGTVYRLVSDFLTERGLLEEIKRVLYARSPDLVADLGHAAGKQFSTTLVAPVLKMALSLFGQTPASMFGHLDRFFSMVVRGFSLQYEPGTAKQGAVVARIEGGEIHRSLFEQIRGNLLTIYDLCNVNGSVGDAEILRFDAAGAEIRLPVRWE